MSDVPIPNMRRISKSVQDAAGYLASVVEQDHGTDNGTTALYWHLISVCQTHRKDIKDND